MVGPKQKSVVRRALPPTWCLVASHSCSGRGSFCWDLSYLPRCAQESWQQSRRHRCARAARVRRGPSDHVGKTREGKGLPSGHAAGWGAAMVSTGVADSSVLFSPLVLPPDFSRAGPSLATAASILRADRNPDTAAV